MQATPKLISTVLHLLIPVKRALPVSLESSVRVRVSLDRVHVLIVRVYSFILLSVSFYTISIKLSTCSPNTGIRPSFRCALLCYDGVVKIRRAVCRYLTAEGTSSKLSELTAYLAFFCASMMACTDGLCPGGSCTAGACCVAAAGCA